MISEVERYLRECNLSLEREYFDENDVALMVDEEEKNDSLDEEE